MNEDSDTSIGKIFDKAKPDPVDEYRSLSRTEKEFLGAYVMPRHKYLFNRLSGEVPYSMSELVYMFLESISDGNFEDGTPIAEQLENLPDEVLNHLKVLSKLDEFKMKCVAKTKEFQRERRNLINDLLSETSMQISNGLYESAENALNEIDDIISQTETESTHIKERYNHLCSRLEEERDDVCKGKGCLEEDTV